MTDRIYHRRSGAIAAGTRIVLAFAASTILILWSWNTLAVDLFHAPAMGFRHAVAVGAFLAAIAILLAAVRFGGATQPDGRER